MGGLVMVIYGEYLFIENMLTGLLILYFTAKILGEPIRLWRFALCGICCGGYAFILFTDIHGLLSLAGKSLFSIAMAFLAFGKASPNRLLRNGFLFFAVTVFYGGIAIAILTSFGWTGVTAVSGVYVMPISYVTITAVAACSAWLVTILLRIIREKRMENRVITEVELELCGHTLQIKGWLDSGNTLKEPITGRPVCIVRPGLMETLLSCMEQPELRYTVIPYHSVGVEKSLLEGYRIDRLVVRGKSWNSPILAVCEETDFLKKEKDVQILLPGMLLERGLNGDIW